MDRRNADLPAPVYLGLVLVPLVAQVTVRLLDPGLRTYKTIFNGELGFIELGTAALLLVAVVLLALQSRRMFVHGERWNGALLAVLAVGGFLFMGEEISWGQWFFRWDSPDWFLQHNAQGETNLHNLTFVKKDIAKWIVVLGIAVFGLIMPLRGGPRVGRIGPFDRRLLPTHACVPVAALVVASHLVVKLTWWFMGLELEPLIGIDVREATEFYVAMFGLIYALSLRQRLGPPPFSAGHAGRYGAHGGGSRGMPANPAE
ncbi:MAG: hypothetical protein ACK4QW_08405 [Alphaproteobacteria bacterium]